MNTIEHEHDSITPKRRKYAVKAKVYNCGYVICNDCGWKIEKVQREKTDEPGIIMVAPDDWEFLGWQDDDETGKLASPVYRCPDCQDDRPERLS